jgi:hypothetical protein
MYCRLKHDIAFRLRIAAHTVEEDLGGKEEHCRLVCFADDVVSARLLGLAFVEAEHLTLLHDGKRDCLLGYIGLDGGLLEDLKSDASVDTHVLVSELLGVFAYIFW